MALSDTSAKHRRVPPSLFTLSNSILVNYIHRIAMLSMIGTWVVKLLCVRLIETLSGHKGLIGLTVEFNY